MQQTYPFELMPLPYSYDALEPYMDAETLHYHHDKHLKTYIDNLNKILKDYPQYHDWTLEDILKNLDEFPEDIRQTVMNNAGGVYNHNLYFSLLSPNPGQPAPSLSQALNATFGSMDGFKTAMKTAAMAQFGSGYAWLVLDQDKLVIVKTANQDTPLPSGFKPLLLVDVWEHAYYLKYQNMRAAYLDAFWNVVNWSRVSQLYDQARQG